MKLFAAIWRTYSESSYTFLECVNVTPSLNFTTQLNGGFGTCTFKVVGSLDQSQQRKQYYRNGHVVIFDVYGRRVYEGSIEDLAVGNGGIEVTAYGYFFKAKNVFFDMIYLAVEATTNRITNPSWEVDTGSGWTLTPRTGGAATRVSTNKVFGTYGLQITQPSAGGDLRYEDAMTVTGGSQYTFSIYVKNIDSANIPYILIEENDGGATVTRKDLHGWSETGWVRFELTVTMQAGTTSVNVVIGIEENASQGTFLIDGAQFENKPYATSYCDGDQAGCSWTGTPHASTSNRAAYNPTIGEIVTDAIELVPEWEQKFAFISDSDYALESQDFTDKKIAESIESIMGYGYQAADLRPIYFSIYEGRVPKLFPEPVPSNYPNWFISIKNVRTNTISINESMSQVFNKVYAAYDNTQAGVSKTLPAEDALSQFLYGVREGLVQNADTPEGIAIAEDLRDMALERYKYPRQVVSLEVHGLIRHSAGFYEYPYFIRAGDQILLTDFDIITAHQGTMKGQVAHGLGGFVLRTSYDGGSNTTRVDLGATDMAFEIIMSRLGLGGGIA